MQGDGLFFGKGVLLGQARDDLALRHGKRLQARRRVGEDDDAEVQLIAFELFADAHGAFFIEIDVEMRVFLLEAGENLGEEVGADHRRDADLDRAFLQLLVIVDFEHGVLDIAQRKLDAGQKYSALGRQRQLLLTAVKELDAKFRLKLLDRDGDVRL